MAKTNKFFNRLIQGIVHGYISFKKGATKFKNRHFERKDSWAKIITIYLILGFFCVLTLYPILSVLGVALRPVDNLLQSSLAVIPHNATLDNFKKAFTEQPLLTWLENSLIVSILTTVFGIIFSVSAGYAYSRFNFVGKQTTLTGFLLTQIFPATMVLLPTYVLLKKLNLLNTFTGLVIPYVATAIPFAIWTLKGYFDTIPKSLEESAYIDGCGITSAFFRVILPLAKPSIAISALFSFMTAWSEYIVARTVIMDKEMITLPVALVNMMGEFQTKWGIYSATALITALPAIIVFILFSKYLVGGLTVGSVKG